MSYNIEAMAEIAITKIFKIILSFGYWGSGLFFADNIVDGKILESLPIPSPLQNIAAAMFIAMTGARLVWFIYDKFFLENRERKLKIQNASEDLEDRRSKRIK